MHHIGRAREKCVFPEWLSVAAGGCWGKPEVKNPLHQKPIVIV